LLTIPGISIKSAAAVIGKVGNIEQFHTAKQLIGYVGCHPRFNSSGTKEGRAFMSKAGNKGLLRSLWQCTIVAIRHNPFGAVSLRSKVDRGQTKDGEHRTLHGQAVRFIWAIQTYNAPFDATGGTHLATVRSSRNAGA
jgi:transposase